MNDDLRAFVHLAVNGDAALDLLDIFLHDVHPHAASRNAGDLPGRAETRQEDEVGQLAFRHPSVSS